MNKTLFKLSAAALVVIASFHIAVAGDKDSERDRRARVALSLADCGTKADCDRKARVAFALAEADVKAVPKKAPCPCCDGCGCGDKCPACPAAQAKTDVRESLVRVRRGGADGTGTVIWSDGQRSVILTAAHVYDFGTGAVTVRGGGKWHNAEVLAKDSYEDLAAILVCAGLPAVAVSEKDPAEGDDVLMLGCSSLLSRGKIASIEQRKYAADGSLLATEGNRYLLGYDSEAGDSGGGVFLGEKLVGVHLGKYEVTRTPHCAGAKSVRGFLARVFKRNGSRLEPVQAVQAPTPTVTPAAYPAAYPVWVPAGPTYSTCPSGTCQPTYRQR